MQGVLLIYSGFSVDFSYSTLAPFFPAQLQKRGFSSLNNSAVFAIYALSYVISALLSKRFFIPKWGRLRTFTFASIAQLASILMLGCLPYIPNDTAFLVVGILGRFIQGGAAALQVLIAFAILSLTYKTRIELMHNLYQVAMTLGLALSPFSGSFVYKYLGYRGPFIVAAMVSLPPLLLPFAFNSENLPDDQNQNSFTFGIVLKNKRAMLTLTYFGLATLLVSTLETCLCVRLMDIFKFKPNDVALFFFIFFTGALVSSIICALLPRQSDKSKAILIALFLCSFSFLLIGPSTALHIPREIYLVATGLFLAGSQNILANYAVSQTLIYTKPHVLESQYGGLVNSVSLLRTLACGLAFFIGPIMGGLLTSYFRFSLMTDIYALVFLLFALLEMAIIISNQQKYAQQQRAESQESPLLVSEV